jgi:hypothetical protein
MTDVEGDPNDGSGNAAGPPITTARVTLSEDKA